MHFLFNQETFLSYFGVLSVSEFNSLLKRQAMLGFFLSLQLYKNNALNASSWASSEQSNTDSCCMTERAAVCYSLLI